MADTTSATVPAAPPLSALAQLAATTLQTILTLLIQLGVGSSSVAGVIIQDIIVILPIITDEAPQLVAQVKNILALLQNSGKLTDAQLALVQQLQAASDSGFDAAAAAYLAAHPQKASG